MFFDGGSLLGLAWVNLGLPLPEVPEVPGDGKAEGDLLKNLCCRG